MNDTPSSNQPRDVGEHDTDADTVHLRLRVPLDLKGRTEARAAGDACSVSDVVRNALLAYLAPPNPRPLPSRDPGAATSPDPDQRITLLLPPDALHAMLTALFEIHAWIGDASEFIIRQSNATRHVLYHTITDKQQLQHLRDTINSDADEAIQAVVTDYRRHAAQTVARLKASIAHANSHNGQPQ